MNILKFAYFNVVFYSFFFRRIWGLMNNLKTFNEHVLILVGRLLARWHRDRTGVFKIV